MERKNLIFKDSVLIARTVGIQHARRIAAGLKGDVRIVDERKAQVVSRNVSISKPVISVFKFLNGGK